MDFAQRARRRMWRRKRIGVAPRQLSGRRKSIAGGFVVEGLPAAIRHRDLQSGFRSPSRSNDFARSLLQLGE